MRRLGPCHVTAEATKGGLQCLLSAIDSTEVPKPGLQLLKRIQESRNSITNAGSGSEPKWVDMISARR